MSSFAADWLALREPYDSAARNRSILHKVLGFFADCSVIDIVDLACGTGATARAISAELSIRQRWRLVDNDLSLLARTRQGVESACVTTTAIPIDLARDLEAALDGRIDLITTSAFLDLVSAEWFERFAVEAAARNLPVYAALTYDGRVDIEPSDSLDTRMIDAVNHHQRTDKGFGTALGPSAADAAIEAMRRVGYTVSYGRSDWILGPQDQAIQRDIAAGWASAARNTGDLSLADTIGWLTRRRDAIAASRSSMRIGHVDFFAHPIGNRSGARSQSNKISSPNG